MSDDDLRARVRRLVAAASSVAVQAPLRPEQRLTDDLGFDSLALVELAVQLESEFPAVADWEQPSAVVETVADLENLVVAATSRPT